MFTLWFACWSVFRFNNNYFNSMNRVVWSRYFYVLIEAFFFYLRIIIFLLGKLFITFSRSFLRLVQSNIIRNRLCFNSHSHIALCVAVGNVNNFVCIIVFYACKCINRITGAKQKHSIFSLLGTGILHSQKVKSCKKKQTPKWWRQLSFSRTRARF